MPDHSNPGPIMTRPIVRWCAIGLFASLGFGGLPGCEEEKGPAEKAGETIDEAAEETREGVEDAGDELEDATDN